MRRIAKAETGRLLDIVVFVGRDARAAGFVWLSQGLGQLGDFMLLGASWKRAYGLGLCWLLVLRHWYWFGLGL